MNPLSLRDLDYDLPKELIAQAPSKKRDESRLLVVHRKTGRLEHRKFSDILEYIPEGDALVLNDTRVYPARLIGKKINTDGKADLLLLEPFLKPLAKPAMSLEGSGEDEYVSLGEIEDMAEKVIWRCLLKPTMKEGQEILFAGTEARAVYLKRDHDGIPLIEFLDCVDPMQLARSIGIMPLPPYIKREAASQDDTDRYQTVYAEKEGAVAAPTAGLHFTEELLKQIKGRGIEIVRVTLHVGYGTFKTVESLEDHRIHSERFELSNESATVLNRVKESGKKIWAVGTTSVRTLETCVLNKKIISGKGETDIFIRPPFEFEATDHLITNFHLPRTTLLLLVSAFMGEELRKKVYAEAIAEKYRFYSYGDAMVII